MTFVTVESALCAIEFEMCNFSQIEDVMNNMLTAKEVQQLLQVDRSTVYRMAEDGRLPAVKVGKQWRFPADQLQQWLGSQVDVYAQLPEAQQNGLQAAIGPSADTDLAEMLPLECVQLIQDSHAELLGGDAGYHRSGR